jgi:peroxiredoxin 3
VAFSDRIEEFKAMNAEVLGISCDSKNSHLTWTHMPRNQGGVGAVNYPLVADYTKNISRDYGVLDEQLGFPLRGTFIVDPDGNLRHILIQDEPVGRSVDETLRVLAALQHNKATGEVCPANWTKGQEAINKPKAGEWFKKHLK